MKLFDTYIKWIEQTPIYNKYLVDAGYPLSLPFFDGIIFLLLVIFVIYTIVSMIKNTIYHRRNIREREAEKERRERRQRQAEDDTELLHEYMRFCMFAQARGMAGNISFNDFKAAKYEEQNKPEKSKSETGKKILQGIGNIAVAGAKTAASASARAAGAISDAVSDKAAEIEAKKEINAENKEKAEAERLKEIERQAEENKCKNEEERLKEEELRRQAVLNVQKEETPEVAISDDDKYLAPTDMVDYKKETEDDTTDIRDLIPPDEESEKKENIIEETDAFEAMMDNLSNQKESVLELENEGEQSAFADILNNLAHKNDIKENIVEKESISRKVANKKMEDLNKKTEIDYIDNDDSVDIQEQNSDDINEVKSQALKDIEVANKKAEKERLRREKREAKQQKINERKGKKL